MSSDHRNFYWIANCVLSINQELPEIPYSLPSRAADWTVDVCECQPSNVVINWDRVWKNQDGDIWMATKKESSCSFRISYPDYAEFIVHETKQNIQIHIQPGTEPATWRHLLLDQVLPTTLGESGEVVLHGAASLIRGRAIALVAPSGSGKSTLATSLVSQGHPLLSDDFLRVDFSDQICVWPSYPGTRLREDSTKFLGLESATRTVAEYTDKFRIALNSREWFPTPVPLQSIMLLKQGAEPQLEPLTARQAVFELTSSVFRLDYSRRETTKKFWNRLCQLVRTIPVFFLKYPRGFEALPACQELLLNHAESTLAPPNPGSAPNI